MLYYLLTVLRFQIIILHIYRFCCFSCAGNYFFFFFFFFFYESLCQIKQGIQDSIANVQYPNYKDINTQNEKGANIKVKLMKVWI